MAIKTFHEAPISIFSDVQKVTSGDYALVHLFEENPEYYDMFAKAVKQGREVILDNSIFELGVSFNPTKYIKWIKALKPTWYIIPDVLEDANGTIKQFDEWVAKHYKKAPKGSKTIAVAQGDSIPEMMRCFTYLHDAPETDMIAISFDYKFYLDLDEGALNPQPTKYHAWAKGRQQLLLLLESFYNSGRFTKPVHLLGCGVPQEPKFGIARHFNWVYSIDTSNPVVAGFEGVRYGPDGLDTKSATKLFTIINDEVPSDKLEIILKNIEDFKGYWNT